LKDEGYVLFRNVPLKLSLSLSALRRAGVVAPVPGVVPCELRLRDLESGTGACCFREDIDLGSRYAADQTVNTFVS
jgi:hypothetical protein